MGSLKIPGIVLVVVGFAFLIVGILVGELVPVAVYNGIKDALVIDKAEPEKESYQHWLNSNFEDATPIYKKHTFFNLTNQAAVQSSGAKPIYAPVGPYTYRYYTLKNEVNFSEDGNEVSYKVQTEFHFVPELSGEGLDPMTDKVTLANIPYFSIINQAQSEYNLWCSLAGGTLAKMMYVGMIPNYQYPAIAMLLPPYIDNMQNDLIQEIASNQSVSIQQATLMFYSVFANDTTDPIYDGYTSLMRLSINGTSTGLSATQVGGLLGNSSISVTNPAAYSTWFGASAGNPAAIAGIKGALGLTDAQFAAIMNWRVRFITYATPYMLAAKGLTSLADVPIYQWATGNFANVDPMLYLGQPLHIEFAAVAPAFGYTGGLSLASAKLVLLGSHNLTDPMNIAIFLAQNATPSGSAYLQATYSITSDQQYALANYLDKFLGQLVNGLVAPSNFFRTETVNNWLWNTTDPLVYTILGQQIQTNYFTNNSNSDIASTFKTGKDNIDDILQYVNWRNRTEITSWKDSVPVQGTPGTNFKPLLSKDDKLTVFVDSLLRPVLFDFQKTVTVEGITLNRYTMDTSVLAVNETFYQSMAGLGNMTSDVADFKGAPVYLSKINFLDAPEKYLSQVEGLTPDRETCDVFLDVEPLSGATMRIFNRLQLNVLIDSTWSAKFNKFNKNIPTDTLYPVVAIEQTSQITEKQANAYKSAVYGPLVAAVVVLGVGVGIGGLMVVIGTVMLVVFCVRKKNGSEPIEMH